MRSLFAVVAGLWLGTAAAAADFTASNGRGSLWVHEAAARQLSLAVEPTGARGKDGGLYREFDVALRGRLGFDLAFGHYAYARTGALALDAPVRVAAGKRVRTLALSIVPHQGGDTHLALATAKGDVWFTLDDVHQRYDDGRAIAFGYQDLRVGPALAKFLGRPAASGQFVGAMHFMLEGESSDVAKDIASCNAPSWPGTPGTTTNVALTALTAVQPLCEGCDGTGNNPAARVKLVPSVALRNIGTSDVPWYPMFYGGTFPPSAGSPPPYGVRDQHPFLVWNVYRIANDGRLEQVARSGVKHAFATGNEGCLCRNFNVLAPECGDTYDVGSNEYDLMLGPRSDVIAYSGEFGRCGSRFDDGNTTPAVCDGVRDSSAIAPLDYRAVVPESVLAQGGRFFMEAWYVIRDDVNIYDTMGSREFVPQWVPPVNGAPGFWRANLSPSMPLVEGPVLDRYATLLQEAGEQVMLRDVVTPTGKLKVLSRATSIGNGRYRYEYQVANFDFSRPTTDTSSPFGLRVLSNRGIAGVSIPLAADAGLAEIGFRDGNGASADDWATAIGPEAITWTSSSSTLDWGSTYRVDFTSTREPAAGNLTLSAADGAPATLSAEALLPVGAQALWSNGFE